MTDRWCPFAEYHPIYRHEHTGPMSGGAPKILHHTVEGDRLAGAEATYGQTGNLPHFTDSYESGTYWVVQHLPLDQYATALARPKGARATNTDNVIQIEHVGHAASSSGWAPGYLDGIGILCRWIELQTGCLPVAILPFVPGVVRLPWKVWHETSGHCGHMHAPFQDHTDPGAMDIGRVLTAGATEPGPAPIHVPPLEADGMNLTTEYHPSNRPLDSNGHGWIDVAHDFATVAGLIPQGPNPPVDDYWPPVIVEAQPHEGRTRVSFYGKPGQQTGVFVKVLVP